MRSNLFLILFCSCVYADLSEYNSNAQLLDPIRHKKLHADLNEYLKRRDDTKLPPRHGSSHERALRASNFRATSDHARFIDDIFEFVNKNVNDVVSLTRSSVVKRSITTTASISTLDSTYCPYQYQTILYNATTNLYRSYEGTCNNLKFPLLGAINTPYIRFVIKT